MIFAVFGEAPHLGNNKHLALLSYLTVCIVWGSTYLAIQVGVTEIPFLFFGGIRFVTAGALILTTAGIKGWTFPKTFQDYKTLIIAGLLLLFISNGLISWAALYLETGLMALLVASVPLFMALIEIIVPHTHRISSIGWVGLIIGFVGVGTLVSPHFNLDGQIFLAILAVLGASLNWAIGSVYLQRRAVSGSMMPIVGIQMFAAGTAFLLTNAVLTDFAFAGASVSAYAALLYLIFVGSILAYTAFNYMLQVYPAAKAGTYAYVNPIVALILGAIILNETITAQNMLAAVVILGGVILVQISKVTAVKKPQAKWTENIS